MLATGESKVQSHKASLADRAIAASASGLLGLIMLIGVGFVHAEAVHDAAHDTRHAIGFPCH